MSNDMRPLTELAPGDLKAILQRVHTHCQRFDCPDVSRSVRQLLLSLALYGLITGAGLWAFSAGQFWALPLLLLPGAGLLVKLFTIQHDCGHGSYFKADWANRWVGRLISLFTLTPYAFWRDAHNKHHASSGNLDRRGIGGIDMITVGEFENLSPFRKRLYRIYRHPLVLLTVGAPLHTIVIQRWPVTQSMPFLDAYHTIKGSHLLRSVMALNAGLVVFYGMLIFFLGWAAVFAVFVPLLVLAAGVGGWLFYVQHQYDGTYWARQGEWDYKTAALLGSSHYALPRILHWFTGNIGYHHIHHLVSKIPNYRLAECYRKSADLQRFPKLTLRGSIKAARLRLWDEKAQRMVAF
ncbi:MAG: fatty acid desaturase [Pseudomonadota bacterium]